MKQPALAFEHFSRILTRVDTPYAKARAGYWGGRAAEAQGKPELAAKWYAAGADHMATFYGQLAAHQLGHDAPPRPAPEPVPDATELAQFDDDEVVRAARIFFELGDGAHGKTFLIHLADNAKTPAKFAMLAHARRDQRAHRSRDRGGQASDRSRNPADDPRLPGDDDTGGGTAEHSLLFAIMRQESAFERDAVSRVGRAD